MTVLRYQRKPLSAPHNTLSAALYTPGPSSRRDLRAVATLADPCAELAEVQFPSGPVLVVRWSDEGTGPELPHELHGTIEHTVVRPGHYLTHSLISGLFETDDTWLRRGHDPIKDAP